jgi:hypothetical protein
VDMTGGPEAPWQRGLPVDECTRPSQTRSNQHERS